VQSGRLSGEGVFPKDKNKLPKKQLRQILYREEKSSPKSCDADHLYPNLVVNMAFWLEQEHRFG